VRTYLALTRLWLRGNRFECPCCGGRFRRFQPHGVKRRQNARCPGCGALERHRLQWLFLKSRTNLYTDRLRVLHFAPEISLQRQLRKMQNLDYVSADLDSPRADVWFDICAIPYLADSFDVVLCSHVLEHVPDDRLAMRELCRVMKPGGWGIIQVPMDRSREDTFEDWSVTSEADRERVFGQRDHVRVYGNDYYDRLREAGFEVQRDTFVQELSPELIERYRLPKSEVMCVCRKRG
jgi:SAM-dependent methyltransferase